MVTQKVGKARVSYSHLTEMLPLPKGHRIIALREGPPFQGGYFEILIEGPTLPETEEGTTTPDVEIIFLMELGEPVPERKFTTRIQPIEPAK